MIKTGPQQCNMATFKLNNFSAAPSGWLLTVNLQKYCKTCFFCVPFISRAWQVRKNNGPQKFEYSSVSV